MCDLQPELFNWQDPDVFIQNPPKKRKRQPVDYDAIYKELFLKGEVTFKQIEDFTGVSHNAVAQVITTLCLRYPIYDVRRGVYKLCEDSDYKTVNWEKLKTYDN